MAPLHRLRPGPVAVVWRDPASHTGAWLILSEETIYPGLCITLGWLYQDPAQPETVLIVNSLVHDASTGRPPFRVDQATAVGDAHAIPWGCIVSVTPIHLKARK